MKKTRMTICLAAVLVLCASFAFAFDGGHGRFGHNPVFRMMHKLQFTDQQKQQVAVILKQNESGAKTVAADLANARVALNKAILSGADVTASSQQVAVYEEQAAQLRSQIMAQIIKILTPAQKEELQKMVNNMGKHVSERVDRRFEHLDQWLAKHGQ